MSIDPDQDIGALVGFENKLVLRGDSKDIRRKVILVEGPLGYGPEQSHIAVRVQPDQNVEALAYDVDTRLGRLMDNGSLESKLWVCYLHAVTSFCLPDPLTGRTGTEQALDILDSAAVKSFPVLSHRNISRLEKIAGLTPVRVYYPEHLKVMQTVSRPPRLGFLAQHNSFFRLVASLFKSAADRAFLFREQYVEVPELDRTEPDLVRRDEIRSATFRVSQYGAEQHTMSKDSEYSPRDVGQDSEKFLAAYSMADYILNAREQLPHEMPARLALHIWKCLSGASREKVWGSKYRLDLGGAEETPEYDAHWLLDTNHEILASNLVLYHVALGRPAQAIDTFDIAFWLASLAFSKTADMAVIQFIASMVNERAMDSVKPPAAETFFPARGFTFYEVDITQDLEKSAVRQFTACPEYQASKGKGYEAQERSRKWYADNCSKACRALADCVGAQWPCGKPRIASHERKWEWATYVKENEAISAIHQRVTPWFDNYELESYITRLASLVPVSCRLSSDSVCGVERSASYKVPGAGHRSGFISNVDVFLCPPPELGQLVAPQPDPAVSSRPQSSSQSGLLDELLLRLDSLAVVAIEKDYVASLRQSIRALESKNQENSTHELAGERSVEAYLAACKDRVEVIYSAIKDTLDGHMSSKFPTNPHSRSGHVVGHAYPSTHCPRVTPSFLLQHIARVKGKGLPSKWKECITWYGVALTQLQRAERMSAAMLCGDTAAMTNELLNAGHKNWDPLEYPDSLLLEVESGITIRDVQEEVSACMRSPPDAKNAVMQLNMGEGKSSVIVPIVASALADGTQLVRVFVAKPQSKQMLQMMTSKLGGLLDRVVFQMPFSRDVQVTQEEAGSIRAMLDTCLEVGGVLLVQPEHVLSLQQMGTEFAISPEKAEISRSLNQTRNFLFHNARDIVDESDENFSIKFELVYTMGHQQPIDHSPQRWQTIQEILGLLRDISPDVQHEFPDAIEIQDFASPGSFPRTRVLKEEAMQSMLERLVSRICDTGLSGFPLSRQTPATRDAVRIYLTKRDMSEEEISRVEQEGPAGFWSDTVRPTLALLRGLIAGNVLAFALTQKRWRVNYGLAPGRRPQTRLAVPYRAKDQPSPRSEFSHPDVVVILNCLAYYYSGLRDDDIFLAVDDLLRSDQAEIEYARWVDENVDMPKKFKTLAGVNTEDREQCIMDVFPYLRLSKAVVDYFLNHVVYPKEMKEFPSKLSASGWDLGEEKAHPTTGFSGTNDSRMLLPLGMQQLDLQEQKHTNALVMSYLLQPETSVTNIPPRSPTQTSDADVLLDLVVTLKPPVKVILDVGAQVLELGNFDVARRWLQKVTDNHIEAVIFFDDNDELSVVDRSGHAERLQTSPFASKLDACLVQKDEAHTRGTDLRLPTDYRAAVTLGANQTKDGLMQGCMRMRKLGHGQSVVFCVPREIKTKIRELLPGAESPSEIQVSDILIWSIQGTWTMLERGVQLWATQGRRHEKHRRLWTQFTNGKGVLSQSQANQFLEDEAQTLLERYRPRARDSPREEDVEPDPEDPISARLRDFGALKCDAATLHEEQERELAPEIETEREMELPPPAAPASHSLHRDVKSFVVEGTPKPGSAAYTRAFTSLARTRAGRDFDVANIPAAIATNFFVSADFAHTVKLPGGVASFQDLYLRPAQWVLVIRDKAGVKCSILLISPYEANHLIPTMGKKETCATLHIYTPKVNPVFPSLDNLELFCFPRAPNEPVPRPLTVSLNLFSGQLYFNDYEAYLASCNFLGLSPESAMGDEELDSDGFILRDPNGRVGGESGFQKSPVKLFRDLMLMRRDSQAISSTHVGDMLDNRPLSENTFN